MIRKICSILVAMLCIAGFTIASSSTADAAHSVIAKRGAYMGMDHYGNVVRFHFSGNDISNFYVGSQSFGGAYVGSDAWHERCNNGWCFKGHWVTSSYVVGEWRHGSSHEWHAWSASIPSPYVGRYMGKDHQGNDVKMGFNGSHVHGFTINGYGDFPSVMVQADGYWHETCSHHWCYRGHFEDDYFVVGEWRTPGSVWHPWEARAFAS